MPEVQNVGSRIPDPESRIWNPGSGIADLGSGIQDPGKHSFDKVSTKFRRSFDEVSTKLGFLLRSSYEDRGPSYEVPTKIGVSKGQSRLPVDAI